MHHAAPAEAPGRAFGHERHDLAPARRAAAGTGGAAASASGAGQAWRCARRGAGELSARSGIWLATGASRRTLLRAEPLLEAVDERRAALRAGRAIGDGGKLGLPRLHAFGGGDGEAERLEAEAGIEPSRRCARA